MNAEEAYKLYRQSGASARILEKIKAAATGGHVSTSFPAVEVSCSIRKELELLGFSATQDGWVIVVSWDPVEIAKEERLRKLRKANLERTSRKRKLGGG